MTFYNQPKKTPKSIVRGIIKKADMVLEVLDARMPELTRNRRLEGHMQKINKQFLIVVNKADIVSKKTIDSILRRYAYKNFVIVSSKTKKGIGRLTGIIRSRIKKPIITVAVVGYPNTGKSSLINVLSKGGRARTSPESGFTKGIQLISGRKNLRLYDTPGVIPFEANDEIRLGLVSGISPSKLENPDLVAYELIKIFQQNNPDAIREQYGISPAQEPEEILLEFGRKRHMLMKGNAVDERRAAIQMLIDWHEGKIRI